MRFKAVVLFASSIAVQSISTVLPAQAGLNIFTTLISQFPGLLSNLDAGNFTVLAPTDDAFAALSASGGSIDTTDDGDLKALLQYHVLQGLHPSLSFTLSPQFLPTLLTNNNYTNVTGGQRVEAISQNGTVSMYSAVKPVSKIVTADALFTGGVLHTIDTVLTIPNSVSATITKAGLNDLVALLSKIGVLTDPTLHASVTDLQDLTVFACNSPQYSGSYTGWNGLPNNQLQEILESALVDDTVAYSPSLTNQSTYKSLEGEQITITVVANGSIYADASLVTSFDYLTSNGVMHIIDAPLTPNTSDARPMIPSPSSHPSGSTLSSSAKAGIGIAVALVLLVSIVALIWTMHLRKRSRLRQQEQAQQARDPHWWQTAAPNVHEKEVNLHSAWELDGQQRAELSGGSRGVPTRTADKEESSSSHADERSSSASRNTDQPSHSSRINQERPLPQPPEAERERGPRHFFKRVSIHL